MIIDIHIHRGPIPGQYVKDYSLERILESMDTLGIGISVSCNTLSLFYEDLENGAVQACSDYAQSKSRIRFFIKLSSFLRGFFRRIIPSCPPCSLFS